MRANDHLKRNVFCVQRVSAAALTAAGRRTPRASPAIRYYAMQSTPSPTIAHPVYIIASGDLHYY